MSKNSSGENFPGLAIEDSFQISREWRMERSYPAAILPTPAQIHKDEVGQNSENQTNTDRQKSANKCLDFPGDANGLGVINSAEICALCVGEGNAEGAEFRGEISITAFIRMDDKE